ncbi:MAG: hypothetical protein U9Q68_04425 [Euryarchaeota archaeon]|nr:hypothetical protein [Euryarchaeota archaeon]
MGLTTFIKDPDAVLDFSFDWSSWLETGESISSHTITAGSGITNDSDSESSGIVTAWISGGTAGSTYTIACKIVTSLGRTDERTINIVVAER